VFNDLGCTPSEAQNLLIRSDMMIYIRDLITRQKLSQVEAARLFHVTQPRISDLARGKIELFSIDILVTMLERAGIEVEVRLKSKAA
jgi:predicted XRE-type DNA-binding protein